MKPHPRHCPLCGGAGWRMVRSGADPDKRNQPPMFIRVACGWYEKSKPEHPGDAANVAVRS